MLDDFYDIRPVIMNHPELPVIIMAAENDTNLACGTPCESYPSIGEVYDGHDAPDKNKLYTDRKDFEHDLREIFKMRSEFSCLKDEEFDVVVKRKMKERESFWRKCVIIYIKPARNRRFEDRR